MINKEDMKVLIVDDMPSMTKFIHRMLKNLGYGSEFFFAHTGKDALITLKTKSVDIIFMDYNMPEMTGREVLSEIRSNRELRDIPVIMVTAEAKSDFVAEVGETEVDAYILKPITTEVLQEKITTVVENFNNPPPVVYHLKRAREFEDMGDLDSAIKEAHLARQANPDVTKPIRELGYYYYKKNDLKNAEAWLLKAADTNKLDVIAFHYLGEIYISQKNIEKASYYLDKAMEISPRHIDRGINFGKTLVKMNEDRKAIEIFDRILEFSENNPEAIDEIADFCLEYRMDEYIVKLLEPLVLELPKKINLLLTLAKAHENLNALNKAATYLNRALRLDENSIDIRLQLAKIYMTINKPMLAEKPLKEILVIDPENEVARDMMNECA